MNVNSVTESTYNQWITFQFLHSILSVLFDNKHCPKLDYIEINLVKPVVLKGFFFFCTLLYFLMIYFICEFYCWIV